MASRNHKCLVVSKLEEVEAGMCQDHGNFSENSKIDDNGLLRYESRYVEKTRLEIQIDLSLLTITNRLKKERLEVFLCDLAASFR